MVFNRKGSFFLNLDQSGNATPAVVAPVAKEPAAKAKAGKGTTTAAVTLTVTAGAAGAAAAKEAPTAATPAPTPSAAEGKVLTTAEAIAAELAAEQAARPERRTDTFAPECVTAGGALPMRRRRGGANLAGFRSMAGSLFGKK
jgi:hypothetical protein